MGKTASMLTGGLVAIGMATALFLPGRTTATTVTAGGNAIKGVFGTAISGK